MKSQIKYSVLFSSLKTPIIKLFHRSSRSPKFCHIFLLSLYVQFIIISSNLSSNSFVYFYDVYNLLLTPMLSSSYFNNHVFFTFRISIRFFLIFTCFWFPAIDFLLWTKYFLNNLNILLSISFYNKSNIFNSSEINCFYLMSP